MRYASRDSTGIKPQPPRKVTTMQETISIQIANTITGEYDVKLPLPKPLHCDSGGNVIRPHAVNADQVIGFANRPDSGRLDLLWKTWVDAPSLDAGAVLGMFPVIISDGHIASLNRPVSGVLLNGDPIHAPDPESTPAS